MKKFICFALILILLIGSLCACTPTIVDGGVEREIFNNTFIAITDYDVAIDYCVVYEKDTKIVYYLETAGNDGGYLSPYLIYQDGYIYGAVFQDGEIKPAPYASAPLN